MLRNAYEQLAYVDYRSAADVMPEIEAAQSLGVDGPQLDLVCGLAALGVKDEESAIQHLEQALAISADDLRARYMLAWAHWREGAQERALENIELAEQQGLPKSPDAWFFRGLALH